MNELPTTYGNENVLIIVLDSCRWDVFCASEMNTVRGFAPFKKAYAQATFTYPAHLAMYQGYFPSTQDRVPYYDRKSKPLFQIDHDGCSSQGLITFPAQTRDIVRGFAALDYYTLGIGSAEWFHAPQLYESFENFIKTPASISKQRQILIEKLASERKPFFCLLNVGETHCPYGVPGYPHNIKLLSLVRDGISNSQLFDYQVRACRHLDAELGILLQEIRRGFNRTIVIITADHGECFGEDGLYGHTIYHQKVMEVPLGLFMIGS